MTTMESRHPQIIPARPRHLRAQHTADIAVAGDLALATPPDDDERDSYFRAQHRWIPVAAATAGMLTTASMCYLVISQWWAVFFIPALALSTIGTVTAATTSMQRRRTSPAEHRAMVDSYAPQHFPSIDVFLPSAGEDLAVLRNTFQHVAAMEWPGLLTVYVLDDSGRDEVATLAADHGFEYRSRPNRGYLKKAGNLRYGYELSDGDFIAILDADFVPRTDYLAELMPYSADPDVGLIQSPQYFDMRETMNWVQNAAGATQILFYRWIQQARDRSDASICVGTCALYRRAALERIGGFPRISHSEDVYTGIEMHRVGYRTRYVPTVVSKGLCPDSLDQFVTQQYRWCNGSMSLLLSRQFHRTKMKFMQRLSFWAGFIYYIDTSVAVFFLFLPPTLMALFSPEQVSVRNYIFVFLAMAIRLATVPIITMGTESNTGLTRISTLYSFAHAISVFDVLRGRVDSWQATGVRGSSPTPRRVRRLAVSWLLMTQVIMWALAFLRGYQYGWLNYLPMIAFNILGLLVAYPIILWRTDVRRPFDPMGPRRALTGLVR